MQIFRFQFHAMASVCEVVISGMNDHSAEHAANRVQAEVARIQSKFSRYRADSVLGHINAEAANTTVAVDGETRALLNYADKLYELSDGLFDITTGVLQSAWDFKSGKLPQEGALKSLLHQVGWSNVQLDAQGVSFTQPGISIDFGGFGKEYAVDRAAAVLSDLGVTSGYINLGGDVRAIGPKADGSPWIMGIQHPRKPRVIMASIPLTIGALATSGDYERYFEKNGRRYCHILSPQTGMPVQYWQSVSVLSPMAVTAGAMTTIAMLKESDGLNFLRQSEWSFLAIDAFGTVHTHDSKKG
jgi:FAD:protein FMN transferase